MLEKNLAVSIPVGMAAIGFLFLLNAGFWSSITSQISDNCLSLITLFTNWGLYFFYGIFLALLIFSLIRKNRKHIDICLAYIKAQLIFAFAAVRLLKIIVGRARPLHGTEINFFSLNPDYNSFPSGHTADAFVSGVFLYFLLKNSKFASYRFIPFICAYLIGISRILVHAHYPLDVLGGMLIGILGAWLFIARLPEKYL
jgi:membrane-associated phospholipid phosphatase